MISVLQFKYAILKFSVEQAIHPLDSAAPMVSSPTLGAVDENENSIVRTTCMADKKSLDRRIEGINFVDSWPNESSVKNLDFAAGRAEAGR
jgi:hypothetical protein